jgi:alkaline phosphatase
MRVPRRLVLKAAVAVALPAALALGWGPKVLAAPKKPIAKNIILLIADGSSFNHQQAASYYEYGQERGQDYTVFPVRFAMTTYMEYRSNQDPCYGWEYDPALAWSGFDYVRSCYSDSAAAATAMSTGFKTYGGAIGVGLNDQPLVHAIERAEQQGKATGVITTVQWSHATPSGFVAHNVSRNNYQQLAEEMIYDSAVDVIMGCGHPWYDANGQFLSLPNTFKYVGGEATWDDLVAGTAGGDADGDGADDPWVLIQERAEFQALMSGPTPTRVLGVAQVYQTLQQQRGGDAFANPYVAPFINTVPSLEEMTKAALNILDDDPDGLFLVVEGGAVDWASHANQSGRMIEEQAYFDAAVEAVVDWVELNSNWGETLLIVTGDHETGYLNGPVSDPSWETIVNNGVGILPGMVWNSTNHTNSLIPLFAKGDAARGFRAYADQTDPVRGAFLDNTEVAEVVFWAMSPQ